MKLCLNVAITSVKSIYKDCRRNVFPIQNWIEKDEGRKCLNTPRFGRRTYTIIMCGNLLC